MEKFPHKVSIKDETLRALRFREISSSCLELTEMLSFPTFNLESLRKQNVLMELPDLKSSRIEV